ASSTNLRPPYWVRAVGRGVVGGRVVGCGVSLATAGAGAAVRAGADVGAGGGAGAVGAVVAGARAAGGVAAGVGLGSGVGVAGALRVTISVCDSWLLAKLSKTRSRSRYRPGASPVVFQTPSSALSTA